MDIAVDETSNHIVLTVSTNVTFENAAAFKHLLEQAIGRGAKHLLVDFEGANYVCSSAIGSLIYLFKHIRESGGTVFVITPDTKILRVFELVHIPKMVTFVDDWDSAKARLAELQG
jgi:anti-sigma B factor antagonist